MRSTRSCVSFISSPPPCCFLLAAACLSFPTGFGGKCLFSQVAGAWSALAGLIYDIDIMSLTRFHLAQPVLFGSFRRLATYHNVTQPTGRYTTTQWVMDVCTNIGAGEVNGLAGETTKS
jgi:hypothetical protein